MSLNYPVTVLYYDTCDPLTLKSHLFAHLDKGKDRVLIPSEFRQGRTIVAVLEGEVSILSKCEDSRLNRSDDMAPFVA